jgi:hypothetical protein
MSDSLVSGAIVAALERAALAVGRLDAALAGHTLRPAWTFWTHLDTACRHAGTDGRKVDLFRLAAYLYGLPLKLNFNLAKGDRGADLSALAYAVNLRSWASDPDHEQQRARSEALALLHRIGDPHPALIGAALGLRDWIAREGGRAPIRASLPVYLHERSVTRQVLPPLTGGDALKAGAFDPDSFTIRFLDALERGAENARGLLWTLETEWRQARMALAQTGRDGERASSRRPQAVDMLAASPLLTVSALAHAIGATVEGASRILDDLVRREIAAEVTGMSGRGARRLYGLKRLLPIRAETTGARRRPSGGRPGRPKKILTPPFGELPEEPQGTATVEPTQPPVWGHREPFAFDFEALDRLNAEAADRTRHVHRILERIARGDKPFPDLASTIDNEDPA